MPVTLIKISHFYVHGAKSQACLKGLYNLYNIQHCLSLDPQFCMVKSSIPKNGNGSISTGQTQYDETELQYYINKK